MILQGGGIYYGCEKEVHLLEVAVPSSYENSCVDSDKELAIYRDTMSGEVWAMPVNEFKQKFRLRSPWPENVTDRVYWTGIVKNYLKENKYDCLKNIGSKCYCEIDKLFPCAFDAFTFDCVAGRVKELTDDFERGGNE